VDSALDEQLTFASVRRQDQSNWKAVLVRE
jgi:hypothetical protein